MMHFTTTEVARATGKSRVTIGNWCKAGKIKYVMDPISGTYLIPESELEPYQARNLLKTRRRPHMTVPQVAKILGRTTGDVALIIKSRQLVCVRHHDGVIRIDPADLEAFIEGRKDRERIPASTPGSI